MHPFVRGTFSATIMSLALAGAVPLSAQGAPPAAPSPLQARADTAFARHDYAGAVTLYRQVAAQSPANGAAWNRLGAAYYQLGRFPEAADAYQHAYHAAGGPFALYNAAASYARAGQRAAAIADLDSLARSGFALPKLIEGDSDLVAVRADPAFAPVMATIQRNATPCASEPKARQLDFWVGEWDVTSGPQPVGTSSVQLILGSCVVFENWTGRLGGTGKSFNVYNAATDEWQQYWVADRQQGATLYTQGVYQDGRLFYRHAEFKGPDGKTWLRRLSFYNIDHDHVRQFSERSGDGGATWTTEYDFLYTRKH